MVLKIGINMNWNVLNYTTAILGIYNAIFKMAAIEKRRENSKCSELDETSQKCCLECFELDLAFPSVNGGTWGDLCASLASTIKTCYYVAPDMSGRHSVILPFLIILFFSSQKVCPDEFSEMPEPNHLILGIQLDTHVKLCMYIKKFSKWPPFPRWPPFYVEKLRIEYLGNRYAEFLQIWYKALT